MFFNSIDFAIFLPIVFIIYWLISNKNVKIQNAFIVIASYVFYGWWNWRFLFLILFSTITDYLVGIKLSKNESEKIRETLLLISIIVNISFLIFFKYTNFFIDSFINAFSIFGVNFNKHHLNIILPMGISFYTFQTMSYSIDVYKRKLEPTKDFIAFAAFVSFFPQLVAGPIERAANLLPQFYKKRTFSYTDSVEGCRQMLWGFFKKVVIADNCAAYVNVIWENYNVYSGSTLLLTAILFALQIYGDFSGYSDIAIGTSKLFGFGLMRNFAFPYFSRDIAEFWRRWHISLTTWFRDYIYFPLGGSRNGKSISVRNTFIIFLVSGFWHGANWTFVMWGLINAVYFLSLLICRKNRNNIEIVAINKKLPGVIDLIKIIITFILTACAFIFFRAPTVSDAFCFIFKFFSLSLFKIPDFFVASKMVIGSIAISIPILVIIEWINRNETDEFKKQPKNKFIRWIGYIIITLLIIELSGVPQGFIYFQF